MFVFLGVHFTAFDVLEHIMNAVSVCIAETWSMSCVLFTFCIISLNFHWYKKWYELFPSCNVFCMQAWHFRSFQIRASLCSPCHYIFRAYTTKNLKETCYTCTLSECSLGIHLIFSLLFLTVNVHHKQLQQVMDFRLFFLALYQLWDNFLISEQPAYKWTTQENTLPTSVCAFSWHADSRKVTLPQLCDFRHRMRCEWDLHSFEIYAASIGSFLPTFLDNSWLCNSHSSVGTFRPVDWSVYLQL